MTEIEKELIELGLNRACEVLQAEMFIHVNVFGATLQKHDIICEIESEGVLYIAQQFYLGHQKIKALKRVAKKVEYEHIIFIQDYYRELLKVKKYIKSKLIERGIKAQENEAFSKYYGL